MRLQFVDESPNFCEPFRRTLNDTNCAPAQHSVSKLHLFVPVTALHFRYLPATVFLHDHLRTKSQVFVAGSLGAVLGAECCKRWLF